jgi:trans-aconitate methyltransferase
MSAPNPIDLLFGGMAQLGPGSDADTLAVLRRLPAQPFDVVVDAGCGTGRQTLVLAKQLGTRIHALDSHEPFLGELTRRARARGVEDLVHVHCMDMGDIPRVFLRIDLLWSEGAAYSIGFARALATWLPAMSAGGLAVVSELSWLREQAPNAVREFFASGYPSMQSVPRNLAVAETAGYRVLTTYTLPREAWTAGYYDVLEPRARALLDHVDGAVRALASETIREIEIFRHGDDSYGYVFYVLQRR